MPVLVLAAWIAAGAGAAGRGSAGNRGAERRMAGWRGEGDVAAVERAEQCRAIRLFPAASLYALLAAVPLLALPLAQAQQHVRVTGLAVFLLLSVAQAAACVALLHASLSFYLARPPHPRVDQTATKPAQPVTAPTMPASAHRP
jgi:hypothetical protein